MSKLYTISEDTISAFKKVFEKKSFPVSVGFQFIGSESQKSLIKINKLPEQYAFILEKELIISINEDLMSVFDDESIEILFEQEIDKVSISIDSGKIKMIKPDLSTFASLISKYGLNKIARANQINDIVGEDEDNKPNKKKKAKTDSENEFMV